MRAISRDFEPKIPRNYTYAYSKIGLRILICVKNYAKEGKEDKENVGFFSPNFAFLATKNIENAN